MTGAGAPGRIPAGATPEGDGIVVGHGPVRVDAFIDFLCPFCRQFELSSGPALAGLVTDGLISLAYHPMNFLDQASTTNYSTRAAAASGCAADGGRFAPYAHALFASQPPEGGPGLSDAELARRLRTGDPAVLARTQGGTVLLDMRTVFPDQEDSLLAAVKMSTERAADPQG